MTSVAFDVPRMYADHHVVEIRRILLEAPGVEAVDASSAFRAVKIEFDPDKTSEDALKKLLDDSGYLGNLEVPLETGKPAIGSGDEAYFRHSAAYEAVGADLSFGQEITASQKPLWPCPGMRPAPTMDE
jgi:copper chaperone CopZ